METVDGGPFPCYLQQLLFLECSKVFALCQGFTKMWDEPKKSPKVPLQKSPGVGNFPLVFASANIKFPGTVRLWHQRRVEFLLSITAFLGVALLGVLAGMAVAEALSIINVFRTSMANIPDHTRPRPRTGRAS